MLARKLAALVIVLCACGSKDSAPTEVTPPPISQPPRLRSITLLDPGTGPRSPLRYALGNEETPTRIEMVLTQRRAHDGTWSKPNVMPPIVYGFATVAGGAGKLRGRALQGEILGRVSADARSYLSGWKSSENRQFELGFDSRGRVGPLVFEDDPTNIRGRDPADDVTQRLDWFVVPVPDEAVGVGARWKVVLAVPQRPVGVEQTATYTLTGRSETGWTVGVDMSRLGEPQELDDSTRLLELSARYQGTLEVSNNRALPVGSLAAVSSMEIRITPLSGPVTQRTVADEGTIVLQRSVLPSTSSSTNPP